MRAGVGEGKFSPTRTPTPTPAKFADSDRLRLRLRLRSPGKYAPRTTALDSPVFVGNSLSTPHLGVCLF